MFDGLILSDLHLGSAACQVRAVQSFLEELTPTQRLVLNGDVLESTEQRLTKQHWKVLCQLRKLSDQLELIWIRGNHDSDADAIAHLIGANFVSEYEFESGGRKILCIHGDAWDRFLTDHPILTDLVDWIYLLMQRLGRPLAAHAKRSSKTFLRCVQRVRQEAIAYGRSKNIDVVVCGHTHHAESFEGDRTDGQPTYHNTGCWTDHHCHYWTVQDGVTQLHEIGADKLALWEMPT